jgi:hypothetical protein
MPGARIRPAVEGAERGAASRHVKRHRAQGGSAATEPTGRTTSASGSPKSSQATDEEMWSSSARGERRSLEKVVSRVSTPRGFRRLPRYEGTTTKGQRVHGQDYV